MPERLPSPQPEPKKPDKNALRRRNMSAAFSLVHEIFTHPERLDEIPNGAQVFVMPEDDPELAAYNKAAGEKAQAEGKTVYFASIPHAEIEAEAVPEGLTEVKETFLAAQEQVISVQELSEETALPIDPTGFFDLPQA